MIKILLSLLILIFSFTSSLQAGEDLLQEEILFKGGISLYNGLLPLFKLEAKGEHLGLVGGMTYLPLVVEGESLTASLYELGLKVYSPIAYGENTFYGGIGFFRPSFVVSGIHIQAGTWYQLYGGFERPLGERWSWGGDLRYVHVPLMGIDLRSQLVISLSVGFNKRVAWTKVTDNRATVEEFGIRGEHEVPCRISATGLITGTSLPVSVSGDWSLEADLVEGTGFVSVSGSSGYGSFSYQGTGTAQYSENGVLVQISQTFTSDDLKTTGRATFTVTPGGMRISISAHREDGLSASARINGTTSTYQIYWE